MKTLPLQVTSSRAQQHARGRIINNGRCPLPRHSSYQERPCHPEKKGHACLAQTIAILATSSIRGAFVESAKRLLVNPRWLRCPAVLSLSFLLFRLAALYAQDFSQGSVQPVIWFSASNWTAGDLVLNTGLRSWGGAQRLGCILVDGFDMILACSEPSVVPARRASPAVIGSEFVAPQPRLVES
jgi:hypothetical protein